MLPRLSALSLAILLGCSGVSPPSELDVLPPTDAPNEIDEGEDASPKLDSPDFETCIPDCDEVACGNDGCGGNCGACAPDESCGDGQCSLVCLSKASTVCVGSIVTWVDSCGELEEILETCSTGTECTDGACIPCLPNEKLGCVEGAVHWLDSCGNPGAFEKECAASELCNEGVCVAGNSPFSGQYALTLSPESIEVAEPVGSLTLETSPVQIGIDGAGSATWSLTINGIDAVYIGELNQEQFTVAGEITETLGGIEVVRKTWIQALFLDEDHFAGTWTEMVFFGSEEAAPTQAVWDLNGARIP